METENEEFVTQQRRIEYEMNHPTEHACVLSYCDTVLRKKGRRGFCGAHYQRFNKAINAFVENNGGDKEALWLDLIADVPKWPRELAGNANTADIDGFSQESQFEKELIRNLRSEGHGVWKLNPHAIQGGGVPDLLIITKDGYVLFRELKTDGGQLNPQQSAFLLNLRKHEYFVGIWRPEDEESGKIREELTDTGFLLLEEE